MMTSCLLFRMTTTKPRHATTASIANEEILGTASQCLFANRDQIICSLETLEQLRFITGVHFMSGKGMVQANRDQELVTNFAHNLVEIDKKKTHEFKKSLDKCEQDVKDPMWESIYRHHFHNFKEMIDIKGKCQAQLDGIDRCVILSTGEMIKIDEKVRDSYYGDILLEIYTDMKSKSHGWILKDLRCDYIAYAFKSTKACFLIPFPALKRAWRDHGRDWVDKANSGLDKFKRVECDNKGYITLSIAVPTEILFSAMNEVALW